jgi:hypothetical protein
MTTANIPNIIINESTAFGNPNYAVIRNLLYMVDRNMMSALGRPVFSTQKCYVLYRELGPMCSHVSDQRFIFLCTKNDYWCQWVYQFAHEYCHHLINGTLSGEWSQLTWFEESLCELSSLYNLREMVCFCERCGLQMYAPSVRRYFENCMTKNTNVIHLCSSGGWYSEYADILSNEHYRRDLYNSIAVLMYPLFVENPNLWKIILNIGDINLWNSLEELFIFLRSQADTTYVDSLDKLIAMFN